MNVLVLNPGSKFTKNVIRDVVYGCWCKGKRIGGATTPPFVLIQIASILDQNKRNNVKLIDASAEKITIEEVKKTINNFNIVVMSTSTMSFGEDARYLAELKDTNKNLKTIIFGSHPTFMPEDCLSNQAVDFIVLRDPEFIIGNLIKTINDKSDYRQLAGLGFKQGDEKIINHKFEPKDLNKLPFLNLKFLSKKIDYYNPIVGRLPYMALSTSRGCPGQCTFCTAPFFEGSNLRFQSAQYVFNEIKYFAQNGIKEIYFRDETFFVDKARDQEIMNNIIKEKVDITWLANARIGLIDKEIIALAKKAGCHTIKFGVESGNQDLLNKMKKGYRLEKAYEIFDYCNKIGLKTHAHVMVGVPGETKETVEQTIKYVKRLDPTTASFGICTPYPGSRLFDEVAAKAPEIKTTAYISLANLHSQANYNKYYTNLDGKVIEKYVRIAYRRFYLRINKIFDIIFKNVRNLNDIKRITIAAANVLDFIIYGD